MKKASLIQDPNCVFLLICATAMLSYFVSYFFQLYEYFAEIQWYLG